MKATDIVHHATCKSNYPEKPDNELPKQIKKTNLGDGFSSLYCVDCGAQVNDLPPDGDPYWDDMFV